MRVVVAGGGDFLIAVACDGAGSTSHGGQGASIVVRTLSSCAKTWVDHQQSIPDPSTVASWIEVARCKIAVAADGMGVDPRDFATTLVMAVSNGVTTLAAHIGDGAVVGHSTTSSEWSSLSWPENGEYASTTYFLTDELPRLRITMHEIAVDRLAVLTDGMERLALDFARGVPHAPFFEMIGNVVAGAGGPGHDANMSRLLGDYLASDRVNARTDDDKTLIMAARA